MAWAKFDDMFPWSRKVRRLSDAAFRLHVSGIVACARDLTDGVLTQDDLDELPPMRGLDKRLAELVDSDVWHTKGHRCRKCAQPPVGAWVVHDYLDYNPTKADVEAEKAAARDRQRRRRLGRAGVDVTADVTRDSRVSHTVVTRESQPPSLPVPSLPDPSRPVKEVGSSLGGNPPKQGDGKTCPHGKPMGSSCGGCADARRADDKAKVEAEKDANRRQRADDERARKAREAEAARTLAELEANPEATNAAKARAMQAVRTTTKEST